VLKTYNKEIRMKLLRVKLKGDEIEVIENVKYMVFEKAFLSVKTNKAQVYLPLRLIEKIVLEDEEK